jgi:hypothetical protein
MPTRASQGTFIVETAPRIYISALACAAIVVLTAGGCGGPENVGRVSGTITLDGQPLPGAVVQFQPLEGNAPSGGITDSSGRYTLRYTREHEGAVIGEHEVRISTYAAGDSEADPPKPEVPEKLPAKYNTKTELKASVKSGRNTLDFALESGGDIVTPRDVESARKKQRRQDGC